MKSITPSPAGGINRESLPTQISRYVMRQISELGMGPGDDVPGELQIADELQVSRGMVREAFRSLAAVGVLEINSGKRARLGTLDPSALTTIIDYAVTTSQITVGHVMQLRRSLEETSATLAARNATVQQSKRLTSLAASVLEHYGEPNFSWVPYDLEFHLTLAEASGNPLIKLLSDALSSYTREAMMVSLRSKAKTEVHLQIAESHVAIARAIADADAASAAQAIQRHFDLSIVAMEDGDVLGENLHLS